MNPALLEEFCQLITVQTGLKVREQDRLALARCITRRVQDLGLSGAEAYYHLLKEALSDAAQGWAQHPELQALAPTITTGESYFLRDHGQMDILEHQLLPQLLQQKRDACNLGRGLRPSLRIWSAGCSTGEEVYTLAILVKKLLPDWQYWNLSILGTDLNPEAIERARRGIYKRWSFRQTPPDFQRQHFREQAEGWEVEPSLRKMVLFQPMNLLQTHSWADNTHLQGMDLILCRNVFIYFQHEAIATILQQFYTVLNANGYLITGHSELQGQDMKAFKLLVFPESVVYQRSTVESPSNLSLACPRPQPVPALVTDVLRPTPPQQPLPYATQGSRCLIKPTEPQPKALGSTDTPSSLKTVLALEISPEENLAKAQQFLSQGRYTAVLAATEQVLRKHPNHAEAYYLRAQAYANQGDLAQAIAGCEQAHKLNPDFLEPLYLSAHIAEEQQNLQQTKALLKKILYLDSTSIAAYIDLGTLYLNEGKARQAQTLLQSAWELLQPLSLDQTVQYRGAVSVRTLQTHLKTLLERHLEPSYPALP